MTLLNMHLSFMDSTIAKVEFHGFLQDFYQWDIAIFHFHYVQAAGAKGVLHHSRIFLYCERYMSLSVAKQWTVPQLHCKPIPVMKTGFSL